MKKVTWFVLAYWAFNIANVQGGGKSMVIYIKDESNSNELVSVEVDKEFYSTILQQINLKNKRTTPVNKMDSSKDFLEMVSGGNCKCQCLCCDDPQITTTPSTTTERTTTPSTTTERTTTPSTTTRMTTTTSTTTINTTTPLTTSTTTRMTTTPSTTTRRTTTPSTTSTTTRSTTTPSTTTTTKRTTPFIGPTYLPPATVSTSKRPPRTTRTYGTFTQIFITGKPNRTVVTYAPPMRRSRRTTPVITTTPKYAYYKPKNQFYYPGEGLQVVENGKIVYAVEPVNVDQSIASIKVPTNKWNFFK